MIVKDETERIRNIVGKRILLIALPGYPNGIIEQMKALGAEVDYMHDKPDEGVLCKTLGRLHIKAYQKVLHKYYEKQIEKYYDRNYDYILVIRGEYTPESAIILLRKSFPKSKIILYMWDGLHKKNTRGIEKKWPLFDKVYTFDRIDYEENKDKITFLPLYYYDNYLPKKMPESNSDNFRYDISFIGTGHGDRIKIVKQIFKKCQYNGMSTFSYFYLPHPLLFFSNKLLNKHYKNVHGSDIKYKMLSFEKVYEVYSNSRCVIDVENIGQHGLTMRSIEILGLKRKFITTNSDIVNYDFYNKNNVMVIDREDPDFDFDFIKKPYIQLKEEIYEKYSLKNWILEILN